VPSDPGRNAGGVSTRPGWLARTPGWPSSIALPASAGLAAWECSAPFGSGGFTMLTVFLLFTWAVRFFLWSLIRIPLLRLEARLERRREGRGSSNLQAPRVREAIVRAAIAWGAPAAVACALLAAIREDVPFHLRFALNRSAMEREARAVLAASGAQAAEGPLAFDVAPRALEDAAFFEFGTEDTGSDPTLVGLGYAPHGVPELDSWSRWEPLGGDWYRVRLAL